MDTPINLTRISYIRREGGWEGCLRNTRGLVEATCGHVHQVRGFADRITGAETCMRMRIAQHGAWVLVNIGTIGTGRVVSVNGHEITIRRDVPYVDYLGKTHECVTVPVHRVDPWVPGYRDVPMCDCGNGPVARDGLCAACRAACEPMETQHG